MSIVAVPSGSGVLVVPAAYGTQGSPGAQGPAGTLVTSGLSFRTPQQHGATAADVTSDSSAFADLITDIKASAIGGYQYGHAGGRAYVPQGAPAYRLSSTIDIDVAVNMEGAGTGIGPGLWSTLLHPDAGVTALRVQSEDTVGATGTDAGGDAFTGGGSSISGIAAFGRYDGVTNLELEAHGFHLRAGAAINNGGAFNMQGDAICIHAGVGLPERGNANGWSVDRFFTQDCRNGLATSGNDTNAGICTMLIVSSARAWGIIDHSGASNTYLAPLAQLCGVWGVGTADSPASACHYSGQHYAVRDGQETWASANAPSGDTSSNLGWIWYEAGGEVIPGAKTWFNGMVCRSGGPFRLVNGGLILGGYFEGSEPPVQNGPGAFMVGGTWGGNVRPLGGAYITAADNQVVLNNLLVERGGLTINDDQTGSILLGRYSSGLPAIFRPSPASSALEIGSPDGHGKITVSNSEVDLYSVFVTTAALSPLTDNAVSLGGSGHRYTELWAASATIQTSDRNHKTNIRSLAGKAFDALLDAVGAVPLVAFKFKDAIKAKGKSARDHYGMIAQDLHHELVKRGLDPFAGGVLGCDPVMEDVEEEHEVEREAMRTEFEEQDQIEIVDGKAIKRRVFVEKQQADFIEIPVHDEDGNAIIVPARPPHKTLALVDGEPTEVEVPGSPERPLMHRVRRMETVTEKRTVRKPKLGKGGEPELIWSVRYSEFFALRQAWMERELKLRAVA